VLGLDNLPISLTGEFLARALMFESPTLEPIESGSADENDLTHAAGVSVSFEGGLTGALCVAFSAAPDADRHGETLRLTESYAHLLSLCLAQPGMLDALFTTAHLDGLTGCLNYAAIHHELEREIRRSQRHELSLSCCFIDLDRFKLVNDRYGHLYGSAVLADVARTLGVVLRGEDTLGRYGGDEFVAILPETNEAEARQLADRLRTTISTASKADPDRSVDASIGVAEWQPDWSGQALLAAADEALREAKAAGGGQVIGASQLPLASGSAADAKGPPATSMRPPGGLRAQPALAGNPDPAGGVRAPTRQ
jgi:diguanylate cyclase (GGDEF)-like protein